MSSNFNPANSIAPYLPTSVFFPEDEEQFRVKLTEMYRNISSAVNQRSLSIYDDQEFLTGQQWLTVGDPQKKRQTYRKVFPITDASLVFNHNITGLSEFTHMYGAAFDTGLGLYYGIPYVSASSIGNQIQLDVTATQIRITKGAGSPPAITSGYIVLEYLKS